MYIHRLLKPTDIFIYFLYAVLMDEARMKRVLPDACISDQILASVVLNFLFLGRYYVPIPGPFSLPFHARTNFPRLSI